MSVDSIDDEIESVEPDGPGKQLRAGREARNLDRGQIAAEMHLDEGTLGALEADDYEKLPGAVFIQGYIRNYARILGLPVEPLLEAFQKVGLENRPQTRLNFTKVKREVRSNHFVVRFITWMIILGLIALVVVWWRGYLQWPLKAGSGDILSSGELFSTQPEVAVESDDTLQAEPLIPTVDEEDRESEAEPVPLIPSLQVDGEPVSDLQGIPEEIVESPEVREEVAVQESADTAEVIEELEEVVETAPLPTALVQDQPEVQEEAVEETEESVAVPATEVGVNFTDASWVDIKSSDRTFRAFGVKPAGTKLTLEGEPPYSFVIGNAAAVEVSVNGEPFDLATHTRANVARFSLDPQ